jgi:drug/metabolite transporter (DMT)-like permease
VSIRNNHRWQVILAFALVYVFWGSTYLAIGIADEEHLPPAVMCAMRFLIAGPLMLAACAMMGRRIRISFAEGLRLATIGCLLLVGGNCGLAWAEQWVPTGFAALLVAVTPIWFLLLEMVVFHGDRLSGRGVFGVGLGIGGVALLFWSRFQDRSVMGIMPLLAAGTLLFSSFSWSVGSVMSHKWQMKVDPFTATGWQMVFAAIGNAVVAMVSGEYRHIVITQRAMMATLYLVVFGSWVGYSAYIWLLKHVPTAKVATYAYVNPLVAVFLGWLLHSERLDAFMLGGTVIIVIGVALVTTAKVHDAGKAVATGGVPELESEV